jgi:peptidoglycan/LPS O-acetylase OafA/YrhL
VNRNSAIEAELATALFTLLCLAFVLLPAGIPTPRLESIDKRLGDLTYALYLVHMSVIALALHLGFDGAAGFAATAAATLGATFLVHHAVERPLWRVRDRMRGRAL